MAVPQNILDALNAVQADQDALAAAQADNDAKQAALVQAQTDATTAASAVQSAKDHEATDLAALQQLLQSTYGSYPNAGRAGHLFGSELTCIIEMAARPRTGIRS